MCLLFCLASGVFFINQVQTRGGGREGGSSQCASRLTRMWNKIDEEGNETTRSLGLIVARGTLLVLVSPVDGSEPIANPFAQPEEE